MTTQTISFNQKKDPGQNSGTTYRYPTQLVGDHTDYVRFDFYNYKPPFSAGGGSANITTDGVTFSKSGSLSYYNASTQNLTEASDLKTILLYMPEDLSTGTQIEWAGKGFTNSATDILRSAGPFVQGDVGGTAKGVADALGRLTQRGASVGAQLISDAINKLPGGIGGDVGIQDVLGGIGGVILNPNTELMFGGFGLRSFDLNFKMSPRDEKEAKQIRAICNTFKKASLPSYSTAPDDLWNNSAEKVKKWFNPDGKEGEDQNSNYIGVPNLCQVTFMTGSEAHPYISQFKVCAITKVDINYTPDGAYATYGGAGTGEKSPVATELSIGFTETKLLFRQEVNIEGASY